MLPSAFRTWRLTVDDALDLKLPINARNFSWEYPNDLCTLRERQAMQATYPRLKPRRLGSLMRDRG
jgi:hypothetical protein